MVGSAGTATFNQTGGTHNVTGDLILGNQATGNGTYNLSGTGNVAVTGSTIVGSGGIGTFNQTGGTNTVSGALTIANTTGSTGTYNYSGGSLTAGSIVNNGAFNQSGATTVTANVTTNRGILKTTGTTARFTGTFTNFWAYISDPSDNTFTDLIIDATGYLVGGTGDSFFITNDFINNSANALWNTRNARLVFDTGEDILHQFTLAGLASTDAFSWGTLELTSGNILTLLGSSLYVDTLIIGSGSDLNLDGITLHYRNLRITGGTIDYFNGAQLVAWDQPSAVPEPGTLLLLGIGVVGLLLTRRFIARG